MDDSDDVGKILRLNQVLNILRSRGQDSQPVFFLSRNEFEVAVHKLLGADTRAPFDARVAVPERASKNSGLDNYLPNHAEVIVQ